MSSWKLLLSKLTPVQWVIITAVICLGIFVRFDGLNRQMTDGDDPGVASFIINNNEKRITTDEIIVKIYNRADPSYNAPMHIVFRALNEFGILKPILPYTEATIQLLALPRSWTYAPFQYCITPFLISDHQTYRQLLFWGRFPSFIFSVLALLLTLLFYLRFGVKRIFLQALTAIVFLAFCWENITYAKHMSSYAIGIFAVILFLLLIIYYFSKEKISSWQALLSGFLLALLSNMQYQIIFFVPVFYIIWFNNIFDISRVCLKKMHFGFNFAEIKSLCLSVISYTLFILPSLILFVIPKAQLGLARSVGISSSFYFNFGELSGINSAIKYVSDFFIHNGYATFKYVTAFVPYYNPLSNILALMVLLFALVGLLGMLSSKTKAVKLISFFIVGSFFVTFILILLNNMPLSPTRHYLIYLPFISICVAYGIGMLYDFMQSRFKANFETLTGLVIILFVLLPFFYNYREVKMSRLDPYDESAICSIINKFKPRYIISSETDANLMFMNCLKDWDREGQIFFNPNEINSIVYAVVANSNINIIDTCKINNDIDLKKFPCDLGSHRALYDFQFDNGATLNISNETKQMYNRLYIRILEGK